jgi:hypothetical protein
VKEIRAAVEAYGTLPKRQAWLTLSWSAGNSGPAPFSS